MSASPLKVIVAEDSELQRLYLCSLINALGYQAIEAEDGAAALDLIRNTDIQILISDIEMPNLDGIALTRAIRQLDLDHYVHVIVVTGADDTEVREDALRSGADDFITKGGSTETLKARIRAATRLINHAKELAERTRALKEKNDLIEADLRAAANAQRQLLPDLHDDLLGFHVASAFAPSAIVSGDMFGCFEVSDDMLGFYAVDVSGHGVRASLMSVAIGHLVSPDYFRTHGFDDSGKPDPAALVAALNARFSTSDDDDYFTMFCGIINRHTGQLIFCQAGYPSPYLVDTTGDTLPLGDGGMPVGMLPFARYENNTHTLSRGSALVICSDGAAEAENPSGEPFGNDRVRSIAQNLSNVGVEQVPVDIVAALAAWRAGPPLEDDLTVVALERK